MKAALSIVLLVIAYVLVSNAIGSVVFLLVRRPDWPTAEYVKVSILALFLIALSGGMARLASHWWSRWRAMLALIAIVISLAGIAQSFLMESAISQSLLLSIAIGIVFGAVLLLWPKFFPSTRS